MRAKVKVINIYNQYIPPNATHDKYKDSGFGCKRELTDNHSRYVGS